MTELELLCRRDSGLYSKQLQGIPVPILILGYSKEFHMFLSCLHGIPRGSSASLQ